MRKFGFGQKTGIELPGESAGMLRRVKHWTPSSIGSVAMGHEVSATSLQLARGRRGHRQRRHAGEAAPRAGAAEAGRAEERIAPEKPERVIAPETAITMRQMMEGVVLRGTGQRSRELRGYTSGGKTGSAQIYDFKAHAYTHTTTRVSWVSRRWPIRRS